MLDRQKLVLEVNKIQDQLLEQSLNYKNQALNSWNKVQWDVDVVYQLRSKKWSLLIPDWKSLLGDSVQISLKGYPYCVLAVDGSQVYYDKHQGPACYLLNIGSVLLQYRNTVSTVTFHSDPEVIVSSELHAMDYRAEIVNLRREEMELHFAVDRSLQQISENKNESFLCMLDGSLIFFQIDMQGNDDKMAFFSKYMHYFEQWFQQRILHVGYVSFPRTKELVNVLRLFAAEYDEKNLDQTICWQQLNDMDIVQFFLKPGFRSIVFQSKAPITYLYPIHLKPYFCYLNVGQEVVRLEFPQWIASDETLVNNICSIVLDQADKGKGYPVCLFEAHEQAVVKSVDRDFFYATLRKMYEKNNARYEYSEKSLRKQQPFL